MNNANLGSTAHPQPPSQGTRVLAGLVEAAGIVFVVWSFYLIYAYFWLDAEHPFNAIAVFFGFTQHEFVKVSEYSVFGAIKSGMSAITATWVYVVLGATLAVGVTELAQTVRAGGFKNRKAIRAEAAAKRDAAEGFQAPVDMPPLTKEQWYEILQVTQRAMVREHDSLHGGTINLHPAVRERAEHSVSVMGDICSIIVKELPELEGNLTDSYKAVRAKATTTAAPKRT
jgi:hypothetical protein